MTHPQALPIAQALRARLLPHCEHIHIAGSVRRCKPQVKDIEIVCQPKVTVLKDLFDYDEGQIVDSNFARIVEEELGRVIKGNSDGRQMQIELLEGIMLDLFMPRPYDYYRVLAMRTGSRDYSHNVIATAWNKLGWVGTENGLRRRNECTKNTSGVWICNTTYPKIPPVWKSEEEFFQWLGVKWIEPKLREVTA